MSVLGEIFDEARGVFKDFLDHERFKAELDLVREARAAQQAQARQDAPAPSGNGLLGVLVFAAAAGLATFALVKVLK